MCDVCAARWPYKWRRLVSNCVEKFGVLGRVRAEVQIWSLEWSPGIQNYVSCEFRDLGEDKRSKDPVPGNTSIWSPENREDPAKETKNGQLIR